MEADAGKPPVANDLFLINHFLTDPTPSLALAETVNFDPFLGDRVRSCSQSLGRRPTFIAVDFLGSSDLLALVDGLNAVSAAADGGGDAGAQRAGM